MRAAEGTRMSVAAVRTARRPELPEEAAQDALPPRPAPARPIQSHAARQLQSQLAGPSAADTRRRLDDFQHAMGGPYQVGGREVFVAPPFRMLEGTKQIQIEVAQARIVGALGREGYRKLGVGVGDVISGKGSPEALRRVTQALIDSPVHARYATAPPEPGIRRMMWDHGIGMDCSGYTHHAFLASRRAPASRYALGAASQSGVQQPSSAVFRRVSPLEARSGDFVRLGPARNQHKVIIYDRRELPPGDQLRAHIASKLGSAPNARLILFQVDSSWGADGNPERGGVARRVWAYDDSTQRWATLFSGERGSWHVIPSRSSGPYDHELYGIHRPRSER
jgi:hypothetical protein